MSAHTPLRLSPWPEDFSPNNPGLIWEGTTMVATVYSATSAALIVRAVNSYADLVIRLNSAQEMLMAVACQPADTIPGQLRANLRAEALAAVETLRKATAQ